RNLVAGMVELAASMKHGHHDLDCAHAFIMHSHRNTAAIVSHRHRTIVVDGDVYQRAEACQMLVDRVVDDFPDEVVQCGAVMDVTDVHARTLPDGFKPFENLNVFGAVIL